MAWYWIVLLCMVSSLAGWWVGALMQIDDVAHELDKEYERQKRLCARCRALDEERADAASEEFR